MASGNVFQVHGLTGMAFANVPLAVVAKCSGLAEKTLQPMIIVMMQAHQQHDWPAFALKFCSLDSDLAARTLQLHVIVAMFRMVQ